MGVWEGGTMDLSWTALELNPSSFYPIVAILAVLGVVITAAYILRAIGNVFFGDYDEHKWHDMRPMKGIDKVAIVSFVAILIVIGVFPSVISNIIESGMIPVVERLQDAQQLNESATVINSVHTAAADIVGRLGGA
jgi:NADH-quinone oxidoreductase subunit M